MTKALRNLLELEFAALKVEFEHALLIKNKQQAQNIVVALNQLLPTPLNITQEKLKSIHERPKTDSVKE